VLFRSPLSDLISKSIEDTNKNEED
jgi:hypothetical protein